MIGSSQKLTMARSGAIPPDPEWNISMANWDGGSAKMLDFQYSQTNNVYFKSGGLKMYAADVLGNVVMEYDLSTAWDINTASYLQQSSSIVSQTTSPTGLFFKSDGTKMYIMDRDGDDVFEYDLSTAWDVTTVTYNSNSFSTSEFTAAGANPNGLFFKSDGTKMYICGSITYSNSSVLEYDLSTAWDVTTASYSQTLNTSTQVVNVKAVYFKPDGTKMYSVSQNDNLVAEYNLSTAWDISTATYSQSESTMPGNNQPYGFFMSYDGTKAYVNTQSVMHQYTLSTAWDISTMLWDGPPDDYLSVYSVTNTFLADLFLKSDGTKMYLIKTYGSNSVYEYTLSTAWDMSTASYVQSFSVTSQETAPTSVFFKSDGTKMYVIGTSGDDVNEYNLSTAWNISTASYSQKFSISAQQTAPYGLSFSSDGTKMYVLGDSGDDIDEYDLSTAWDVSTATYSTVTFSVNPQTIQPRGMFFKPDGTMLFVVGIYPKKLFAYNLSTAWDLSTASYSKQYEYDTPTGLVFNAYGVSFKSDGTEFYLADYVNAAILTYYMY